MKTNRFLRLPVLALLLVGILAATQLGACSSVTPNRDPIGERFPSVMGATLEDQEVAFPEDLAGEKAVLLVGYLQEAQFDADRWAYGLLQAQLPVRLYEVPTIPGLVPRIISSTIDSGMRSGIPSEDWSSVVTIYGSDAKSLVEMTGNERGRNMRVFLLDREGKVVWFHDRGFSASKLIELERAVAELP